MNLDLGWDYLGLNERNRGKMTIGWHCMIEERMAVVKNGVHCPLHKILRKLVI